MKKPGESARLYYDGWATLDVGDYIQTRTGRTYLITSVRVQERGLHKGRQHVNTVVMEPDHQVEPDATVHPIFWYAR